MAAGFGFNQAPRFFELRAFVVGQEWSRSRKRCPSLIA